jgi:hypothetical protein
MAKFTDLGENIDRTAAKLLHRGAPAMAANQEAAIIPFPVTDPPIT